MIQNEEKLAGVLGITTEELRDSLQDIGLALLFDTARSLYEIEVASAGGEMIVSDQVPARLLKQAYDSMFVDPAEH
ncbi:hypothetical protein ACFQS6_17585 [Xanthomonas populi]|uniref:Uncharacterized protein n=1 Tax=Xanthomonas populi TaxID=53414 RepID=A0A2S7E9X6_9XANT|nr:hypothetical protein [Xanthomonas populi]PPU86931.1 hypothetical protein XpopCFBP1817_18710 [Xanthomonas populi]